MPQESFQRPFFLGFYGASLFFCLMYAALHPLNPSCFLSRKYRCCPSMFLALSFFHTFFLGNRIFKDSTFRSDLFPHLWRAFLTAAVSLFEPSTGTSKSNMFTTDFIIFLPICSLFMFPNLRISVDSFLLAHLGPTLSILPLLRCSQLPPLLHALCHCSSSDLYSVSGKIRKSF